MFQLSKIQKRISVFLLYFYVNSNKMYVTLHRVVRQTFTNWDKWTNERINDFKEKYKCVDHGLDLRRSSFMKSEVLKANECIYAKEGDAIVGFVYIITSKKPSTLYVSLMVSLKKGIGGMLMNFIDNTLLYPHKYTSLRATSYSVKFYIKFGFEVFDFLSLEEYVNGGTDFVITKKIQEAVTTEDIEKIQVILKDRDWIPEYLDEFPLLKMRNCFLKYNNDEDYIPMVEKTKRSARLNKNNVSF